MVPERASGGPSKFLWKLWAVKAEPLVKSERVNKHVQSGHRSETGGAKQALCTREGVRKVKSMFVDPRLTFDFRKGENWREPSIEDPDPKAPKVVLGDRGGVILPPHPDPDD